MKPTRQYFIFVFLTSFVLQLIGSWWIIGPAAFIGALLFPLTPGKAFARAFLAIFSLWVIVALYQTIPNHNLLASRIALMLGLPAQRFSWLIVLLVTGITGGLAAALAGLSGSYCRLMLRRH